MSVPEKTKDTWDSLKPGDIVRWWDGMGRSWYDLVVAVVVTSNHVYLTFMMMWKDEGYDGNEDQDSIIFGAFPACESMTETGCERVVT